MCDTWTSTWLVMESVNPEFAAFSSKNGCDRPDPVCLPLIGLQREGVSLSLSLQLELELGEAISQLDDVVSPSWPCSGHTRKKGINFSNINFVAENNFLEYANLVVFLPWPLLERQVTVLVPPFYLTNTLSEQTRTNMSSKVYNWSREVDEYSWYHLTSSWQHFTPSWHHLTPFWHHL